MSISDDKRQRFEYSWHGRLASVADFTDNEWTKACHDIYDLGYAELMRGGDVPELIYVFRDRYGRPDIVCADVAQFHEFPRDKQRYVLALSLHAYKAQAYAFLSEAWFLHSDDVDKQTFDRHAERWGRMHTEPRRRESILCMLATKRGFKTTKAGVIHRLTGRVGEGVVDRIEPYSAGETFRGPQTELFDIKLDPMDLATMAGVIERYLAKRKER